MGSGRALGASWRLQERFKSAQDAIFGVLRALRTRFLASWELQERVWRPRDGILVHFGGSERLKMSHFGVRLGVRGPAEWGGASLILVGVF